MSRTYQKNGRRDELDQQVVVPEQALMSLTEIAESAKEGLLALSVGVGLQVLDSILEADVVALCRPRGRHHPDRFGYRDSTETGGGAARGPPGAGASSAGSRGRWLG